jgi:hypothetical protein
MDVLTIILACSLHPDDALVRTLVQVQSAGNVYFVGDLSTLKTNDALMSPEAALRFAEEVRRHGGKPAVGLLGIPLAWAGRYGRAPIDLFDGCTNVAIATAAFAEDEARCAPLPSGGRHAANMSGHARRRRRQVGSSALRACVLARFASDLGVTGALAAILRRLGESARAPSSDSVDPPPQRAFVFGDGYGDGSDGEHVDGANPQRLNIFVDPIQGPADPR